LSVGCTTNTSESEFSVQTPGSKWAVMVVRSTSRPSTDME